MTFYFLNVDLVISSTVTIGFEKKLFQYQNCHNCKTVCLDMSSQLNQPKKKKRWLVMSTI